MPLPITVSPADQAFAAVTSAPSVEFSTVPVSITPANTATAHPSDVTSEALPTIVEVDVSLNEIPGPSPLDFLVMPNTQPSVVVGGTIFSPVVLQITGWPAANKVAVSQATRGVIMPPLNENLPPSGYLSSTLAIDFSTLGQPVIGRQVIAVDRPTYLEFEPFLNLAVVPPALVTPVVTVPARSYEEINGAVVIAFTAPNILTLSRSFNSDPSISGVWIVLDQRQGAEVQSSEYLFAGDFTPESFPSSVVSAPAFLGVSNPIIPQEATPPTLPPNPAQAGPAVTTESYPASQTPPGGLAQNFFP